MNWGKGIAIFFSCFVVAMLGMVYLASKNNHDLVTEDYYEQEVRYQDIINQQKNVDKLANKPHWTLTAEQLEIQFGNAQAKGQVLLFRPSDNKLDMQQPLALNADNKHCIPLSQLAKGMYELKLSWQEGGTDYYLQEEIYVK